jgi:hypothetical protein
MMNLYYLLLEYDRLRWMDESPHRHSIFFFFFVRPGSPLADEENNNKKIIILLLLLLAILLPADHVVNNV